eukprot:m.352073 g.352073  ORF g.352073 m.352073 type:complete len:144 (+) comp16580_c1_seq15:3626-4057(+)
MLPSASVETEVLLAEQPSSTPPDPGSIAKEALPTMSEVRSPVAPSTHNVTEKKSAVALTGGVDVTQGPGSGVLAAIDAKVPTTNCKFAMLQVNPRTTSDPPFANTVFHRFRSMASVMRLAVGSVRHAVSVPFQRYQRLNEKHP